jgi:hypothetical protein
MILATLALVGVRPAHADTVTDWNAIMQTTVSAAPSNPIFQARWSAIVQLAVFEAVNAVTGEYTPYLGTVAAPSGASPDAAVIAAAHRTLVTLRPASTADLNALRVKYLAALPDGLAKKAGIATGEAAAAAVLRLRANDGADQAVTAPYTPGTQPGDWQPAPPANAPAFLPGWGQVTPFGLKAGAQFRLPPPPALHTERYARDYDEVKRIGRSDSPFRPQHRTDVARFFNVTSPVQIWNSAARQISAVQGKTLSENARIFALLAIAICDASIATYETKYHYNLWRPLTAIRGGGSDGNSKTAPEENWLPLIATPAFPSYPSAHATLSNAARTVLEGIFGEHGHAITLINTQLGMTRHYSTFKQICADIDDARIYGGIHFRFDQEAGTHQGEMVGNFILHHYLRSPFDADFGDDN